MHQQCIYYPFGQTMKRISGLFLVVMFAYSDARAESRQYQLGQATGYVALECYKLVDLQKRYCPNFPPTNLEKCIEVSTNFLPSKQQKSLINALITDQDLIMKYELQSRYENDLSFSETLKESKNDKDTACKNQWTAILYFREKHIKEAKNLLIK